MPYTDVLIHNCAFWHATSLLLQGRLACHSCQLPRGRQQQVSLLQAAPHVLAGLMFFFSKSMAKWRWHMESQSRPHSDVASQASWLLATSCSCAQADRAANAFDAAMHDIAFWRRICVLFCAVSLSLSANATLGTSAAQRSVPVPAPITMSLAPAPAAAPARQPSSSSSSSSDSTSGATNAAAAWMAIQEMLVQDGQPSQGARECCWSLPAWLCV